ncbi:hypothetical protein EYF80_012183 [Liparis tanakae]|uniref:Uncharacterized protein n=1 Tax=Liparis tanakae TaxID=230148 RepID=A0A4Z2IK98_9TELE|nr:hypothetical protein EYF80_012183 [Liparis tanakae]
MAETRGFSTSSSSSSSSSPASSCCGASFPPKPSWDLMSLSSLRRWRISTSLLLAKPTRSFTLVSRATLSLIWPSDRDLLIRPSDSGRNWPRERLPDAASPAAVPDTNCFLLAEVLEVRRRSRDEFGSFGMEEVVRLDEAPGEREEEVAVASAFPRSPLALPAAGRTDFFILSSVTPIHLQLNLRTEEGGERMIISRAPKKDNSRFLHRSKPLNKARDGGGSRNSRVESGTIKRWGSQWSMAKIRIVRVNQPAAWPLSSVQLIEQQTFGL